MNKDGYIFFTDVRVVHYFSPEINKAVTFKIYNDGTFQYIGSVTVLIKILGLNVGKSSDSFGGLIKSINIVHGPLSFGVQPKTFIAKLNPYQSVTGYIKFLN